MSRISFTQTEDRVCDPPGPVVTLPFNTNQRPLDLSELLEWNAHSACVRPELVPPDTAQNIFWFGCIDASVSEVYSTLTLPGGIITHRNFGNLFQDVDFSGKAALAHAVTQSNGALQVVVVGHTNCRAIKLAQKFVAGGEAIHDDIKKWIEPLIKLVQDNPNATTEQLSVLNLKAQKQAIDEYLTENFPNPITVITYSAASSRGGVILDSCCYNDDSGNLH